MVRERDLARTRNAAASDQRDGACRMVRGAKRPDAPALEPELSGERRDRRRLEGFVFAHRRQQRRQALREHRLAGAWRSEQQQRMAARRRDLQRALALWLPAHVREIQHISRRLGRPIAGERREHGIACQVRAHGKQRRRRQHGCVTHQRCFRRARLRQDERASVVTRRKRHRERAADRAQLAGERELAREFVIIEPAARQLPARGENADGDGQVESAGFLRQIGRRETDRHLARRKFEARVLQRCAYAIACLAHFGFGEPDDVHAGQAAGQMHFDTDGRRRDAGQRAAVDDGDGHGGSALESGRRRRCRRSGRSLETVAGTAVRRLRPFGLPEGPHRGFDPGKRCGLRCAVRDRRLRLGHRPDDRAARPAGIPADQLRVAVREQQQREQRPAGEKDLQQHVRSELAGRLGDGLQHLHHGLHGTPASQWVGTPPL